MILLTILTILAIIIAVIALTVLIAGGVGFIVIFGDLIVCVAIIIFIIRWWNGRRK